MDRNFSRAVAAVLQHEGGYVNHPNDPGGPTNLGVTLATFRAHVKPDATVADLKALTRKQAEAVYRRQYWDAVSGAELPDGVDYAVFDFAVNSGPSRAAKFLQRIVGVKDDGKIGPATLEAVAGKAPGPLVDKLCNDRVEWLNTLATFPTFGRGWTSRVAGVRQLALELARQHPEAERVVVQPEVPAGSDKRTWLWAPLSGISLTGLVNTFADLPWQAKVGIGAVSLVLVVVMLVIGERIIRRAKRILSEV